jgi:DNA-binding GntR family transcriptional regulator
VRSKGSLTDRAYAYIKRKIIRCEMPPGMSVTESQLVEEIDIGKTPVREALARLVQEGFVLNIPRRGYEVTPITLRDVQELFGLRLILEPAAVQLAAGHVDVELLRYLDDLCRPERYSVQDPESADRHLSANREFHVTIAKASGNRRLAEGIEKLLDEGQRLLHLSLMFRNRSEEIMHEHRELVDALAAGDVDGARRITVEQILAAQRNVVDALLSSPSLLSAHVAPPQMVPPELGTDRSGRRSATPSTVRPLRRRKRTKPAPTAEDPREISTRR